MFKKYASVEQILEVKQLPERIGFAYNEQAGDRLVRFAAAKDHKEEDGYLYVRCRAISSRVNKNNDGWPAEELAKAYKSFIGKPIFVDHNNEDPKRTRGVIVDAQLHVEDAEKAAAFDAYYSTAPDNHKPPTWIELLMEVDAKTYPKLAEAIKKGEMDAVSMGANIEKSVCSVCANEAATPSEYCNHVKQKGVTFEITSDNGEKIRKKAYEDCYGVGFFEISNVFDPADPTADSWIDDAQKAAKVAARAEAEGIDPKEVLAYIGLKNEGVLAKAAATGRSLTSDVMERLAASQHESMYDWQAIYLALAGTAFAATYGKDAVKKAISYLQQGEQPEQALSHSIDIHVAPGIPLTDPTVAQAAQVISDEYRAGPGNDAQLSHTAASFSDGLTERNPQMGGPRNLGDLEQYEPLVQQLASYLEANPDVAVELQQITETAGKTSASTDAVSIAMSVVSLVLSGYTGAAGYSLTNLPGNDKAYKVIEWVTNQIAKPFDRNSSITFVAHPAEQFVKPVGTGESPMHDRNYEPQSDMTTAPQDVDTLRSETRCPVCQAADMETDPDGIMRCPTCGHVQEPEPLDNPDLGVARDMELRQDVTDNQTPDGDNAVPAANPLDGVQFAPSANPADHVAPVAALKNSTSDEGISEMFTLKLRTSKKDEADALVPVEQKIARAELKLGANGIHRGVYDAAREAGLAVKVTYPAIKDEENFVEVPGENGVFNLFFAQESATTLKVPVSEVPIVIEAASDEDLEKFKSILETAERPSAKTAAPDNKQKDTILPSDAKPSDEPKDASVVSDELEPRETKTVTVSDDVVELDGKKYHLTEINDDEAKKDEEPVAEASDEKAEDDESTVEDADEKAVDDEPAAVVDTDKAKELADEVADEDDKESKLLAAFKIADLAVELGLVTAENKMAFIAELEEESNESLSAREATMKAVKTAGLGKKSARRLDGVRRIPRLSHAVVASANGGTPDTTPDEALFL